MKKLKSELLKWWPLFLALGTIIVGLIGDHYLASYRLGKLEDRQSRQGEWARRIEQEISDVCQRCARIEGSR